MDFGLIFTKLKNLIMACKSCGAKNGVRTAMNVVVPEPTPQVGCKYTLEQLEELILDEYSKPEANRDYTRISYIRSAINLYSKDCNMFSGVI
jgi:hypothetical protein